MSKRSMVRLVSIDNVQPIPGADAIEAASVGGWRVAAALGITHVPVLRESFALGPRWTWMPCLPWPMGVVRCVTWPARGLSSRDRERPSR